METKSSQCQVYGTNLYHLQSLKLPELTAQYLADIKQIIRPVEVMFKQGAFVVNIRGRIWHAVGLDEAHEMLLNKKCKLFEQKRRDKNG